MLTVTVGARLKTKPRVAFVELPFSKIKPKGTFLKRKTEFDPEK